MKEKELMNLILEQCYDNVELQQIWKEVFKTS